MRSTVMTVLVGALLLGGCAQDDSSPEPEARPAPADTAVASTTVQDDLAIVGFELPDMDGNLRQSTEWDGQPRLINFWATWCAPCRREIPLLKDTQAANADLGLQVIGIAVDFQEEVAAYAEEVEFNYPVLVGQEDAMAVAEQSGVAFIGLPFTMVVASSGELIKTHIGEIVEAQVEQIVDVFAALDQQEITVAQARERLGNL